VGFASFSKISIVVAIALSSCSMAAALKTLDGTEANVSAEFPFESKYAEVLGSKMHYVDEGTGPTFLLLHGNPTSVYLWRNIIPHLKKHGRVVAVDLIGMGKSDKPDIDYRYATHRRYLEGFIDKLNLTDITLVIHDWGSGLGFAYAAKHESNVRGIAFMEAMTRPLKWADLPFMERDMMNKVRDKRDGYKMIVIDNFFIDSVMQLMTGRDLTDEEMAYYRAPYHTKASRKPVRVWPQEVPFDGKPAASFRVIDGYARWIETTELPKLLLWAKPGVLIKEADVTKIEARMKNLTTVYIGPGRHFVQESQPTKIAKAIASWFVAKVKHVEEKH
jgi:haloalkane dehalogenase